jgi:formamidopyrimidine-DNA glycosylase
VPELPEVETIAWDLRTRGLPGMSIEGVQIHQPLVIRGAASSFRRHLAGRRIESVGRHGKLLIIGLSGGLSLIVHLKMTGQLFLVPRSQPTLKHTHVVLELSGGKQLRYRDVRRFGYLALLEAKNLEQALSSLGPDALAVGEAELGRLLHSRRARIKPLLTDQAVLAGLGNIYANEMLFEARINPWRLSNSLSAAEARRLFRAMRRVLKAAIDCRGSSTSDFVDAGGRAGSFQDRHRVYRRQQCPRCGRQLVRELKGGRPAFYCPHCQPKNPT